jgi:hypothetical protein
MNASRLIRTAGFVSLFLALPAVTVAGMFDDIRSDVREPRPKSSSSSRGGGGGHGRHHHHRHDECGSLLGDILGGIISGCLSASSSSGTTYSYPHDVVVERYPPVEYYFARFPYDGTPRYMMAAAPSGDVWASYSCAESLDATCEELCSPPAWPSPPQTWAGRFRVEYANSFDGLYRIGGHLLVSNKAGWGIDSDVSFLEERLPSGAHDQLWIGDCNLTYRFSQHEAEMWRIGVGVNWLDDPVDTDYGVNFTLGYDSFPFDPVVISSTIDWGRLGNAELFRFRASAGIIIHRLETYVGYEYLDIATTQTNSLMTGVRVWF